MTARRPTAVLLTLAAVLLALAAGAVAALAAPPEIQDVVIDRGRDADWWDWSTWHTRYVVQVQASADEQPAQLWLEDMQGCRQVIQTDGSHWYDPAGTNPGGSWEDARVTAGPDDTYTYVWYEARQENPIPAGSYTITVIGTGGSQTSLTTAELPAVPAAVPALTAPAAEGVVSTTTPTFVWSGTSGSKTMLQVRAEGALNYTGPWPEVDDAAEIWRADVTGLSSVVYNFDTSGPDLDPGRTYFWEVSDWTAVDNRVTDPRVEVWNEQTARHRFTVDTTWPALPSLPGKLAYEHNMFGGWLPYNLEAILQYGTTPSERTWVGPDASHTPSYSWDGTKIAYRVSDWGIRVANADGSDSVRLFGNWAWNNADFSPDATSLTYSDGEWQGSSPQHVFIQKLFEPTRTLVVRARGQRAWQPHWSPDGKWIAYESRDDPSGNEVWLVRPDGTDDHAVVPTSVAGHMDVTITYMGGAPKWSPDAKQLGVQFGATPFEGPDISGIGVIPIEGGEITPIWLDPMGFVCCASAFFGTWSPDGESIVFHSGHHLPFDPDWELGKFESGVEMWLIDADGVGPPTRLTYDYSHPWAPAWWAPNMPDGSDVAITKGNAIITFADVAVGGSASVCIVPEAPGPAPEGYELVGDCWTLLIDGAASGVTVELAYWDAGVAPELEPAVRLLGWVAEEWVDITTGLDTLHEIVTGYATALSYFMLAIVECFEDVDSENWAFGPINACVNAGIVSGYGDGTYQPGTPVTRDQMAVYISRGLAGGDEYVPEFTDVPTFPDVPQGFWALDYVEYAVDQNVVAGYEDGTYHPEFEVTRDQMAVYVAHALVAPTGEAALADYVPADPRNFPDVASGFWAYRHIEYCVENGVVQGYEDGYYHPEIVVTRDQMAVYVARAFGLAG